MSGSRARSARGSIGDGQCVRMSEALRSIGFLFPLVGLGTGASPVVLVGKWWFSVIVEANDQTGVAEDVHNSKHTYMFCDGHASLENREEMVASDVKWRVKK